MLWVDSLVTSRVLKLKQRIGLFPWPPTARILLQGKRSRSQPDGKFFTTREEHLHLGISSRAVF